VAALSGPPTDLYPFMFVGMALLAWSVCDVEKFWRGFGLGALWGTAGGLVGMRFVPSVIMLFTDLGTALALLAHVLLSMGQSLHWALGMGVAVLLRARARVPLELAFAVGILLALTMPSIFLWSPAGIMSPWPVLVQSADLFGERGVSVLMAIIGALGVRAASHANTDRKLTRRVWLPALTALGMLAAMLVYGVWAMARWSTEGSTVRVALVHAGVDPKFRWKASNYKTILAQLKRQTAEAEMAGAELSVWPEAAYPFPLPHSSRRAPRGPRRILERGVRGPIVFGLITTAAPQRRPDGTIERNKYNSATLLTPDGKLSPTYDKMELLWFGETVPFGRQIPWLRRAFQRSGGLIPGDAIRGLSLTRDEAPTLNMAVLNCYEDTLPALGRELFNTLQPNLLVNVTNDAWFVGTVEPELHMRLSVMRSIELRRDMVRAVNLGVSGWVDAAGRVRLRNESAEPGFTMVTPTLRSDAPTMYARFGDWPMWLALLASSGWFFVRERRQRTQT